MGYVFLIAIVPIALPQIIVIVIYVDKARSKGIVAIVPIALPQIFVRGVNVQYVALKKKTIVFANEDKLMYLW